MRKTKKLDPLSIRLEPDVKAAIEKIAASEDRSLAYVINRILRQHVEDGQSKSKR